MKKKEERFIQFPLPMMGEILKDSHSTLYSIIRYGVYKYSKKLRANIDDVSRQVIYDIYQNNLDKKLKSMIESLGCDIIGCNEDYRGFTTKGTFDSVEEIRELKSYFLMYPDLEELCIEHYRLNQARIYLRVTLVSFDQTIESSKKLDMAYSENKIFPMISFSHIWNYKDNPKSEYEIIQLLAFIAIKSIIGNRRCCKTNKQHILARMLGFASIKDIPEQMDIRLVEVLKKYSHRHHMKKLLDDLILNWNVLVYSHQMRGLYIAISNKITLNELAVFAENNKRKSKLEALKKLKNEAIAFAKSSQQLK